MNKIWAILSSFFIVGLLAAPAVSFAQGGDSSSKLTRYWVEQNIAGGQAIAVDGRNTVTFYFTPHEGACKSQYDRSWYDICARRTGLGGKNVEGVVLEPEVEGVWQWSSDFRLSFRPSAEWPAGVSFKVDISPEAVPAQTDLMSDLAFTSKEVMARASGDFKFDRANLETMAVSGSIAFNYAMDKKSVRSRFNVETQGEVLLGEPVLSWTSDGSRTLLFSLPVLSLPTAGSSVKISLEAGAKTTSGGSPLKGMDFTVNLPGRNSLFQLEQASATVATNPDFRARQLLALQFSLPALAAEVQPSMQVLLLPRQIVETEDANSRPPYNWWSLAEISKSILERAEPVGLTLQADAETASSLVSFGFEREIEPGRSLLVSVSRGLAGVQGLSLQEESTFLVQIPPFQEELRIMQKGGILALTGDRSLSIYSRNLDEIEYSLAQIRPEFINHFVSSNYGSFQEPQLENISLANLSVITRGNMPLRRQDAQSAQFASINLAPHLTSQLASQSASQLAGAQKGLFQITIRGKREDSYRASDSRFVLVTDLGLIHKVAQDGTAVVYVASLAAGKPVRGVNVKILGANGLPVFEGETDALGRVDVPNLSGLIAEKKPVAVLAAKGNDLAFLPYRDYQRAVNYSRYDVGGNYSVGGLDAYLFTQRDLYRPGESAHFGYIIKQGNFENEKLAGLPLKAVVYDSRGNVFAQSAFNLAADGLGELNYDLPETALTGRYNLDLVLNSGPGNELVLQSRNFQVEEFQPDTLRLTVSLDPAPQQGWLRPQDLPAGLAVNANLMNLFGAPAIDNRVTATVSATPASFNFRQYAGWIFYDAARLADNRNQELAELQTDEKGDVAWEMPSDLYQQDSLRLTVRAEGFDSGGGRSVKASASMLVSPLEMLVGWRSGSYLGYLRQKSDVAIQLLAIAPDLTQTAGGELTVEIYDVSYVKSLIRDYNGQYKYENLRQEKLGKSARISLKAEIATLGLDTSKSGEHLLLLKNSEGGTVLRLTYYVAGELTASLDDDREPILSARLSKTDYMPGEEVEVSLSTPYSGAGLLTIERDGVVAETWFNSRAGDSLHKIRLPKNFEGTAYLNVTYFRALDDADIFTQPMAATVVPFTVNMDARDMGLGLKVLVEADSNLPEGFAVVRPGRAFPVKITTRKPGRVLVFAVDEGILQMTSYRTPDPLTALLGDRALQVSTYQYFDLLMPEYGLMRMALSAFGGGDGTDFAALGQNPFRRQGEKSAVFWSGPVEVGLDGAVVEIPVPPHFNGQLRIMAVGATGQEISAVRTDIKVQAEVVIQPSLPMFVAPGDIFEAAVSLTDMSGLAPRPDLEPGQTGRAVTLSVQTGDGLELISPLPEDIRLLHAREQTWRLSFRALDVPGGSTINFIVRPEANVTGENILGENVLGEEVERPLGLSIRPGNPRQTTAQLGRLMPLDVSPTGQLGGRAFAAEINNQRNVYPQFSEMKISVSALPLPVAHGMLAYLLSYPFGCTEQTVSKAFPILVALRYPELAPAGEAYKPEALRRQVVTALNILTQRSNYNGFNTWPGGNHGGWFLTVYVADFLMTAKEMGVAVPLNLENMVFQNLRDYARQTPGNLSEARLCAYAAWVLTRHGELTTNILANINAWFERYYKEWRKDIAAVFMAGCWQLMMRPDEAELLLNGYEIGNASRDSWYFFDALAVRAFYISVLAAHFPEKLHEAAAQAVLDEMIELGSRRWYVTTSAAQASRALLLYSLGLESSLAGASVQARDIEGNILLLPALSGERVLSLQAAYGEVPQSLVSDLDFLKIQAEGPGFWQMDVTGFDRALPAEAVTQGLEIRREFRDKDGNILGDLGQSIKQGDEIYVALIARAHSRGLENIAVVDMLPAGFEMILAEGGESVETRTRQGMRRDERGMQVEYSERREDRLLLFPILDTKDSVFLYRVRAAHKGRFTVPPVSAEAMYDSTIHGHSATDILIIE